MNIGLINSFGNVNSASKVNQKSSYNVGKLNTLTNDVFVKSTDNVNFTGNIKNFDETYKACNEEITNYILNEEKANKEGLEAIIQKYSPTTRIDDMKNLAGNFPTKDITGAYTKQPVAAIQGVFGIEMHALLKTMYIRTSLLEGNDRNKRLKLLQDVAHEATHVLQDETDSKPNITKDAINPFLKGKAATPEVLQTLQYVPQAFQIVEKEMLGTLICQIDSTNPYGLPEEISAKDTSKEMNKLFKEATNNEAKPYAKKVCVGVLKSLRAQGINIDRRTFARYISVKAQLEAEAYKNGCSTVKKELGINSNANFDLIPAMYQELDKAAKEMI